MYKGFPGEVKTFFVRGLMFPNEEVFSSSLAHGAVGTVGCSSPLGVALHSGIARSFCFSAIPLHDVGVSAASPICSDFQTFCPDWLHFGHFLCFGGIAASQLSHRIFPIYF